MKEYLTIRKLIEKIVNKDLYLTLEEALEMATFYENPVCHYDWDRMVVTNKIFNVEFIIKVEK